MFRKVKSFLFRLLPLEVQGYYIWKHSVKNINSGFEKFLSTHFPHEYKGLYGIVNLSTNSLVAIDGKVCLYSDSDKIVHLYFEENLYRSDEYKICCINLSTNIIKVYD